MDETFISPGQGNDKVIVIAGTKDVAQRTMTTSFHTTVVACCSAAGVVLPPFFIFPGERQPKNLDVALRQQTLGVALAPKGWINADSLLEWLICFNVWICEKEVEKPVVLIFDGCPSHLCQPGLAFARGNGIELLCLPANSSHITQPLDVCVFRTFKRTLNDLFRKSRVELTTTGLSKVEVIRLVLRAWNVETMGNNAISGFRTTGLWPTSREVLLNHWLQFDNKKKVEELPDWIREKMREEILTISPIIAPSKKRKRKIDTSSAKLLNEVDLNKDEEM